MKYLMLIFFAITPLYNVKADSGIISGSVREIKFIGGTVEIKIFATMVFGLSDAETDSTMVIYSNNESDQSLLPFGYFFLVEWDEVERRVILQDAIPIWYGILMQLELPPVTRDLNAAINVFMPGYYYDRSFSYRYVFGFGDLYFAGDWIYHFNGLGWLYYFHPRSGEMFSYSTDFGWLFINYSIFPYFYSYDKGWAYLDVSGNSPVILFLK